ncbi:MAG: amino acid deaminase [Rhodoferax sp.]|nr:MAG: amino acid deaminase [Rhodoferax sp.]
MTAPYRFDPTHKSFPLQAAPGTSAELAQRGWNVLADDLPYPLAVLRRDALAHNLAWMQDYARRKGVALAPHGKTTMSPELFALQLDAGAWGLTFATVWQAATGEQAGARRIIIANQVLADADLDALDALLATTPGLQVSFLVDSLAQLACIEDWRVRRGSTRQFDVLLEMGFDGGRTGCRSLEQAQTLAQALHDSTAVRLYGIECYEGQLGTCNSAHDVAAVAPLVQRVQTLVQWCDARQLIAGEVTLVSAGGSAIFDLVLPMLRGLELRKPLQGVLRSGCYITHDQGHYRRYLQLVEQREGLDASLQPALEVWALVQSVPEPGLALLSCGRRDISSDIEMPLPQRIAPRGTRTAQRVPSDWKVTALNDQHAYLRFDPAGPVPQVGDRVALGLSHPCTTFDKWRWMVLVDANYSVCGAIHTCF